jgi:hypothetical protein
VRVDQLPMWVIGGVLVFGGLGFLAWHSYARDSDDQQWLDPQQPPAQVMLPLVPLAHGSGAPMACGDAFRGRCYPDVLATLAAVIGED